MQKLSRKFRVGLIGLYHESNTFIPDRTTLEHYRQTTFLLGDEIREKYGIAHHEISGFFQSLDAAGIEAVPILFAHTSPWGTVTDETRDALWQIIAEGLDRVGPLDGILAAPHGAAVSESEPDMDGWWLARLRAKVGGDVPIIATMDPHGNLSPTMVMACQAVIAYRENPHLDQRQRGVEAAELMVRTLRGEIRPVEAAAFPPVAISIERQLTSVEPLLSIHRELEKVRALPGVLSASLALGFPYADVANMGSSFIVVTDNDPGLAQSQADRLARWLVAHRELFRGEMISPEAALEQAAASPKPVGLLDMGDNTGGGAPGDSTIIAHLCAQRPSLRTLFYVPDAESARAAHDAGVGNRVILKIGGKLPMTPAPPLETEAEVLGLYDGKYAETQPRHGGQTSGDMGPTAVVRTHSGMTVLLMTQREAGVNFSAQPLISCALNPKDFDVIILKGVHAPVGAYAEICPSLIRVNTQGATTADMDALPYHHRREPLFPFEEIVPFANRNAEERAFWTAKLDAAYAFMEKMRTYPIAECGEPMASLEDAADGLEVQFSSKSVEGRDPRLFFCREGLIPKFRAVAKAMNERGWILRVEDAYRTPEMQRFGFRNSEIFDAVLKKTIWELGGAIPDSALLMRRMSAVIAPRCRVGTHVSGSAIDISVLDRASGEEIPRGAPHWEMSQRTPMDSPFISEDEQNNRWEITALFRYHGWREYPWEFWHYNSGDCYAEYLDASGRPARYGPILFDGKSITAIEDSQADELLNSLEFFETEIQAALNRLQNSGLGI